MGGGARKGKKIRRAERKRLIKTPRGVKRAEGTQWAVGKAYEENPTTVIQGKSHKKIAE